MMSNVDSESAENSESSIENCIIELAKEKSNGISNSDIKAAIPDTPLEMWTKIINKLLKNGTIELFKDKGVLLYKYKDPSKKTEVKGSDNEERVVYKIIEEAGNKGIWIRDIRFKSNLNSTQLNKVLKSLEAKKYIKAIKSVAASKKKVYMLYDLEPDNSVTGGAWYQEQEFESEFVDVLNQQCHRFLEGKREAAIKMGGGPLLARNRSYVSAIDVQKYIAELGISKIQLSVEEIEMILYTVVLDNKAERIVNPNGEYLYRAIKRFLPPMGVVSTTCGICPIEKRCADTALINPKTCKYLTDWLNE